MIAELQLRRDQVLDDEPEAHERGHIVAKSGNPAAHRNMPLSAVVTRLLA